MIPVIEEIHENCNTWSMIKAGVNKTNSVKEKGYIYSLMKTILCCRFDQSI